MCCLEKLGDFQKPRLCAAALPSPLPTSTPTPPARTRPAASAASAAAARPSHKPPEPTRRTCSHARAAARRRRPAGPGRRLPAAARFPAAAVDVAVRGPPACAGPSRAGWVAAAPGRRALAAAARPALAAHPCSGAAPARARKGTRAGNGGGRRVRVRVRGRGRVRVHVRECVCACVRVCVCVCARQPQRRRRDGWTQLTHKRWSHARLLFAVKRRWAQAAVVSIKAGDGHSSTLKHQRHRGCRCTVAKKKRSLNSLFNGPHTHPHTPNQKSKPEQGCRPAAGGAGAVGPTAGHYQVKFPAENARRPGEVTARICHGRSAPVTA
jgi:hypothetical protein